jgi:hypothetical protein
VVNVNQARTEGYSPPAARSRPEHRTITLAHSWVCSREGVRAVALAFAILGVTAAAQAIAFALSGSLALLADPIHNGGDALTAIPLRITRESWRTVRGHPHHH